MNWKDIKKIIEISDSLIGETPPKELLSMGEEKYYKRVFDAFMSGKDSFPRIRAITILKEMNLWRRGEGKYDGVKPMPYSPEEFGEAIDFAIKYME